MRKAAGKGSGKEARALLSPPSGKEPTTLSSNNNSRTVRTRKKDPMQVREREDGTWGLLEKKLGGRDGLLGAAVSSSNPKAALLAELLLDPAFRGYGTKQLARKAGMSAPEIVDLYRDQKLMESMLTLHEHLPNIVEGAAVDAAPKMRPCEECKGSGKQENTDDCWVCGGWGQIRHGGDKDKLSFIGEVAGISGKKGPIVQNNVQINAQTQNASVSFEDLMRRATVSHDKKAIEGEIIDVEQQKAGTGQ